MIGLLDCNNFFVSCERLFRPDLEGVPVAVLSSNDGCIVARSQEVKDLGITMGAPYFQVKDICEKNNVTLFSGNLTLYRDISARVMDTLASEVGKCEIYSIDEAFFSCATDVSIDEIHRIRDVVMQHVGIPVSIGVASTKTLAKQSSNIGKKGGGYHILSSGEWAERAVEVGCGEIWGLGRQTTAKLREMRVRTAADFMQVPLAQLRQSFGVGTQRVYDELHGTSVFPVGVNSETSRQSIASTRSFTKTTTNLADLESSLAGHITHVAEKLRQRKLLTSKMHISINTDRFGDFFMQGESAEIVLIEPTADTAVLLQTALTKMRQLYKTNVPYKKTGVTVSGLMPEAYVTPDLFAVQKTEEAPEASKIDVITDSINARFGGGTLRHAVVQSTKAKSSAKLHSKCYTTNWGDIPSVKAK
jgi:DNA polymerase V